MVTTTTTTTVVQTVKKVKKPTSAETSSPGNDKPKGNQSGRHSGNPERLNIPDPKYQQEQEWTFTANETVSIEPTKYVITRDDEDALYLGLKVYTHKDVPVVVVGRLKAEPEKDKKDSEEKKSEEDKGKGVKRQSLSSLVDSLEDTCDCDECRGRQSHPYSE